MELAHQALIFRAELGCLQFTAVAAFKVGGLKGLPHRKALRVSGYWQRVQMKWTCRQQHWVDAIRELRTPWRRG